MKRTERERLEHPRPRDVDGFTHAASLGFVPSVPSVPPSPATGLLLPSANRMLKTGMARLAAVTAVHVLTVFGVLPRSALPGWFDFALLLTLSAGWFIVLWFALKRPGKRTLDEMMHGYSTLASDRINYFGSSEHSWDEGGPPWDYSGVWVLDRTFTVRSAPNPHADPPGFYPSPHRAGEWELWTGVVWSGIYRNDPWPRSRLEAIVAEHVDDT